jgi:hypothetical protein
MAVFEYQNQAIINMNVFDGGICFWYTNSFGILTPAFGTQIFLECIKQVTFQYDVFGGQGVLVSG